MMEDVHLIAKSSSGGLPHDVAVGFLLDDDDLLISCSCPAGMRDQICHHKTAVIANDRSILEWPDRPDQIAALEKAQELIGLTTCREDIQLLHELEKVVEQYKTQKSKVADGWKCGFKRRKAETAGSGSPVSSVLLKKTPPPESMTYWELQELARKHMAAITSSDISSYAQVIELFELSITKDHTAFTKSQTHRTLGELYQRCGMPQKAIEHFEMALRLNPGIGIRKALAKLQATYDKGMGESQNK
jgi:tetratricopeptide (TPR) repeat protein